MVSCDNRFSVLSLYNEEEIYYDEIQNKTITYSSKTYTKSSSINIKHPHPKKNIYIKKRIIFDNTWQEIKRML